MPAEIKNICIYKQPGTNDGWVDEEATQVEQRKVTVLKFHFMEKDGHAHVKLKNVPLAPGQQPDFDVYPDPPQVRTISPRASLGTYDYEVTIDGDRALGRPPGSDPVIIIHPPNE
jgi:hypothetical protein